MKWPPTVTIIARLKNESPLIHRLPLRLKPDVPTSLRPRPQGLGYFRMPSVPALAKMEGVWVTVHSVVERKWLPTVTIIAGFLPLHPHLPASCPGQTPTLSRGCSVLTNYSRIILGPTSGETRIYPGATLQYLYCGGAIDHDKSFYSRVVIGNKKKPLAKCQWL